MRVQTGEIEQILFKVLQSNGKTPATGRATIRLRILRTSDDFLFDFADLTFKASGHTTLDATMAEVDATNAAGIYNLPSGFNTGTITNASPNDTYLLIPSQTSGNDILPSEGTIEVGFWADDIGKIDDFATTGTSAAQTGSLLDLLANKDSGKTYDQSTDSLEAHTDATGTGVGARQVTIHVNDQASADLPGVEASVFNDTNTVFLTRGITDSNGDLVVALDDNSYNVRLTKAGFGFTVPEPFTVTMDETFIFSGTAFVPTPPSAPNLNTIFGTLRDAMGKPHAGVCVVIKSVVDQVVSGVQETEREVTVVTDVNGFFEIELERNALVSVVVEEAGIDVERTVPDAASQDFATWT